MSRGTQATHVIDVDPELLQRTTAAALHSSEQAVAHMDAEIACRDESGFTPLMDTLTPHGPWAWAIKPEIRSDGSLQVPIATTREEIGEWYHMIRGHSDVIAFEPLIEVRGAWYTFMEGISVGCIPSTQTYGETETVLLLPVSTTTGITGELAWWRMDPSELGQPLTGTGETGGDLNLRREMLAHHDRYLDALRAGDVEGMLEELSDGVQSAVRDYVDDSGTLTSLDGKSGYRDHYDRLLGRFEIRQVDLLYRVVQPWYLFAELRWTVAPVNGAEEGGTLAFHTADLFIPVADGRFIAQIGHGTDVAAAGGAGG